MKITAIPNSTKTGFDFPSEYNAATYRSWLKKYKLFSIEPIIEDSVKSRRYLEGAVMPAYCEWQYAINAREPMKDESRRFLFKRDFNYEVVKNRKGSPVRMPLSSKGFASFLVEQYSQWATENGAPIPNPELYKLWRDKWSMDLRFPSFFEFLDFLGLECDAMPSAQTLEKLGKEKERDYPKETYQEPKL